MSHDDFGKLYRILGCLSLDLEAIISQLRYSEEYRESKREQLKEVLDLHEKVYQAWLDDRTE